MRITIQLDDELLARTKRVAAATGRTPDAVIEDALRHALGRAGEPGPRRSVELTTFHGGGLQPGVNLVNAAALLDVLESGG